MSTAACLIGGCDARELAAEFGTPAYVVAEDDLRAKAREFTAAMGEGEVVYASKAFPCTAVLRVFEAEGLSVDVASGGELALARRAGYGGDRIVFHGNAKSEHELRAAAELGARIVVDNFDDLDKLERIAIPGQGDDPGHARRRRRHARQDPHRPRRLEVRALDRPGADRDRPTDASPLGRPARPAHAHRLPALRPRAVALGGRGARHARRLPRLRPRRRARRGLHAGPPPADGHGVGGRDAPRGGRAARPGQGAVGRAGPRARGHRRGDAVHGRIGQGRRPARRPGPFRRRRRGHVGQHAPDALRRAVRRRPRPPRRRERHGLHGGRQALRVRRRADPRDHAAGPARRATCSPPP